MGSNRYHESLVKPKLAALGLDDASLATDDDEPIVEVLKARDSEIGTVVMKHEGPDRYYLTIKDFCTRDYLNKCDIKLNPWWGSGMEIKIFPTES